MPKIRRAPRSILLRGLTALTIAIVTHPTAAIVIRHDRDDARYVELGARFPSAVSVLPDGSGVLIAPDWVLTAAHVARGVAQRSPRVEIGGREHEVERIFVHPRWREMGPHDVGLLKLKEPAEGVTPVELYTGSDEVGQVVTFVGRGDTGTGLTGPRTADGEKRGATNRVESADDDWIFFEFDEGEGATDLEGVSGPGDSGGPALVNRDGKLYTLGVSVFSDGRGKGPGRYGVLEGYTRVSTHRGWIESVVSGKSTEDEVVVGSRRPPAAAQGSLQSAIEERGQAIERLVNTAGDEALQRFAAEHLSPEFIDAFSPEELLDQLKSVRSRCANPAGVIWEALPPNGLRIVFQGEDGNEVALQFRVELEPPHRIVGMTLKEGRPTAVVERPVEPIEWATLTERLAEAEDEGFSGVVLVVRAGEVVLHRGYGMADPTADVPNTKRTVFAIGSTPIDFTKAAILKLEEMAKLRSSDPIDKFLDDVPEDKRSITIEHLMTGRSGLQNFHHVPGEDGDPDLTWIDRETAIRRILGRPLLFAPGEGEAHSHSAWVLLAAIVEIVSGQPYGDFLKERLFGPAGMGHTGLYQDSTRFDETVVAVGLPPVREGKPNSPRHWGPTSWLVMGSGGMVSNPGDLYRWNRALRDGKLLSLESLERYWSGGVLAGGNDRGFLTIYTEGPATLAILCSNSHVSMNDGSARLGKALARLVLSDEGR